MADTDAAPKEKSSASTGKVKFMPKRGTTRVVLNVPSSDEPIDVGASGVEVEAGSPTALALEAHPSLKQD